jgi:large subunit ribosomal protein L9
VTVADGFARNYLFPRGLAILADRKQIGALDKRNARIAERTAGHKAAAETLREKLHGKTVRLEGKVGRDSTKLFGAITSQDVVDAIKSQLKIEVEKKQVALIEPIKRLGTHEVELDLHREVEARVNVEVFDPNAIVEAPKAEEEESAEDDREPVEA